MNKYYLLFLTAVTIAAFGQVALKKGAGKTSSLLGQYLNIWVLGGYLLFFSSMALSSLAYRGIPLKSGPVLDSLGFVLVPLLSRVFFGEKMTASKFWGFTLILLGVVVFSA